MAKIHSIRVIKGTDELEAMVTKVITSFLFAVLSSCIGVPSLLSRTTHNLHPLMECL